MSEPTNQDRADRVDTAMQAYCLTLEGKDFEGDEENSYGLLFTDGTVAWIMCDPEGTARDFWRL